MTDQKPLVYRINTAMMKLGVSRTTIYRLIKAGELEHVSLTRFAAGVTARSVDAFLEKATGTSKA